MIDLDELTEDERWRVVMAAGVGAVSARALGIHPMLGMILGGAGAVLVYTTRDVADDDEPVHPSTWTGAPSPGPASPGPVRDNKSLVRS